MRHSVHLSWAIFKPGIISFGSNRSSRSKSSNRSTSVDVAGYGNFSGLFRFKSQREAGGFFEKEYIIAPCFSAETPCQLRVDFFLNETFHLKSSHEDMAASFRELAMKKCVDRFVRKGLCKFLHPGQLNDLWPEVQRGDAHILRIIGQRAQAKDISAGAGRRAELSIGMREQLFLRSCPAAPENLVAKLHFMCRFVVSLLAEEVSDGLRILV